MPEISREYTNILTDIDRIKIRQLRDGHNIIEYSVQYEALVNSRWRKITRFDNAHGYPHRHVFRPDKTEYRYGHIAEDNNSAFTESQMVIKKSFNTMREQYIMLLRTQERRGN